MNNRTKKTGFNKLISALSAAALFFSLCGCTSSAQITSDGMVKVGSMNVESPTHYTDESPAEDAVGEFTSENGLCTIVKYPSYYDVTLDYEKGTPAEVGAAYAETILKAVPDYEMVFEPYLFENIRNAFSGRDIRYDSLEKRIMSLVSNLPDEYREEVESFAKAIADGEEGYLENGKLSYIEALTMQMIPDALRPTACSALSIGGTRTVSGERLSLRNLEWSLGSSAQMTQIHAVTFMKKGENSITAISVLGLLDMITAVNDDGVMIGILMSEP